MKVKLTLIVFLIIVVISGGGIAACTGKSSAPEELSLDATYSGKEVEIAAGGSLMVTLESNKTTGFSWELKEISDKSIMNFVESKYEPSVTTQQPPLVGAGGKETWSFKALKKGKTTISMEYSQPWAGGTKAVKAFSLTVVVK